jgi:hypothetical protein
LILGVAIAIAFAATGLALSGSRSASRKTTCKPSWFVPSVSYRIGGGMIDVADSWTFVTPRKSSCFIDPNRPFSSLVNVIGRNGYLLTSTSGGLLGHEIPGGGGGGGSFIPVKKWCAHQPVRVEVIGAGPDYATTGKGYHLVLNGIRIRC